MRPTLKKLLALALAALMLLPMTACGTGDNGPDPSESATQGQTEGETQNTDYVCDLPAELDYGGDEISIMVVKKSGREDEMLSEALGNGIISDAVYERNLAVETDLGVVLAFRGIVEWTQSVNRQGKLLCVAVTLVGVILILMPMSASRLVFSVCGLVLVVCGGIMLAQRLRTLRYLPKTRDDIIDAL